MNHKKIGVENFRVFKGYTEFEIKPITLLIGPNNSGKSSFPKLLMLLKNGLGFLDFKQGKHNLEDFTQIVNWKSEKKEFRIELKALIPFFKELTLNYVYSNGRVSGIYIQKRAQTLLEYKNDIGDPIEWAPWAGENSIYEYYSINIENIIDLLFKGDFEILTSFFPHHDFEYEWLNPNTATYRFENFRKEMINMEEIDVSNYRKDLGLDVDENVLSIYAIKNEIARLKKSYLLFDLYIDGEKRTTEFTPILRDLQKKSFQDIKFEDAIDLDGFDLLSHFADNIPYLFQEVEFIFKNHIDREFKKFGKDNLKVKISRLGQLIFKEKWFNFRSDKEDSGETLFSQLVNFDPEFRNFFNQIDFLSANRGNQRRVLQNESEVEIDKIVADFAAKDNHHLAFIEKAFNLMEIPGKLVPVRYENTISVLYLENGDMRISLADLGFGFSQLIPIFLKIIMSKKILIIEEPEANLHPDLQSKLADILQLTVEQFPEKNLIIETHSEYLLRKLQYLTAKKELSPEECVIYYFNADKHVSKEEPKVKKIEITSTGNLTDTFGPGFYDEATRLKFDLMKVSKEQNN